MSPKDHDELVDGEVLDDLVGTGGCVWRLSGCAYTERGIQVDVAVVRVEQGCYVLQGQG
jgi:hypothetical protein